MIDKQETKERITSEQRRLRIIDAALNLFAKKGFAGTRTREIAEAAGISETLIFQHFKTKEELYRSALAYFFYPHPAVPEFAQQLEQMDDAEVLEALARHVIKESNQDPRMVCLIMCSALDGPQLKADIKCNDKSGPFLADFLADYMQKRIDDGVFKDIDARIAAQLFMDNIFMHIANKQTALNSPQLPFSDEELIKTMVDIYISGLKK